MNKKPPFASLELQLFLCVLIAMVCAVIPFILISKVEHRIIDKTINNIDFINHSTQKEVDDFQAYIERNKISSSDFDAITDWIREKRNVIIKIYHDKEIIYDSSLFDRLPPKGTKANDQYTTLYDVRFSDKLTKIEMFCFFEYKYIIIMNYVKLLLSFTCFISIILSFIRRKAKYINKLENEIKILEGGQLDYHITVSGSDEISSLAKSIDDMRVSFVERLNAEEEAHASNHKLVTAMSHDLRTPLTILIGLLEILDGKKYTDNEQMESYISKSREKAYQIKALSDKIFEYFLAFNLISDEMDIQVYNTQVLDEMIADYAFALNDRGFSLEYKGIRQDLNICIDVSYIHRVFDNIFSNIIKYADADKPIEITSICDDDFIIIKILNYKSRQVNQQQGTNIGIETCQSIMQQHNGAFDIISENDKFINIIKLKIE